MTAPAWTRVAPKVPGLYWFRHEAWPASEPTKAWEVRVPFHCEPVKILWGPRIPSPETLAKVEEFLREIVVFGHAVGAAKLRAASLLSELSPGADSGK